MVAQTMVRQLVSVVNTSILIGALPYVAEQALNGIGGLNMPVHRGGELVKGQQVFFILRQAAHRFGIAHSVLAFKGGQLGQCFLLGRCSQMPTSSACTSPRSRLGMALSTLRCLCDLSALARGGRKQVRDSGEQSIMPIGHDEIDVRCAS